MKTKKYNRKSVFARDCWWMNKDTDFMEVVEWRNGEGVDVHINDDPVISLHHGVLQDINKLVDQFDIEEDDE